LEGFEETVEVVDEDTTEATLRVVVGDVVIGVVVVNVDVVAVRGFVAVRGVVVDETTTVVSVGIGLEAVSVVTAVPETGEVELETPLQRFSKNA
jgi:hypothetical protein